jgi:iron complex transport system substrate-binding protein
MKWQGKLKWSQLALILMIAMALFVAGCGAQDTGTVEEPVEETNGEESKDTNQEVVKEEEAEEEAEDESVSNFPVTIIDGAGEEVTIESEPQTIISVLPSNTEMAFALGLGDKIIGVSAWCNFPAEVSEIDVVGDMTMDAELILAKLPDVLLLSPYQYTNQSEAVEQFKAAGIKAIVIQDASSFDDVYNSMLLLGKATGAESEAESIISEMKEALAVIKDKAKAVTEQKKVWVEVDPSLYTTGKGTFMHEMLESIQAINAAGDQEGWSQLTEEAVVELNPDVIIYTYGYYIENATEGIMNRSGWADVSAVKNEQVFGVDNDTVVRPGPRLIDGVETLAKLIYPEIFK